MDLDRDRADRLADSALREPHRRIAVRRISEILEGDPEEHPGLRNKGLLSTHELLHGVPQRDDWEEATSRSVPLLSERGEDLVRSLGFEIEDRGNHDVLYSSEGWKQAVAVFLREDEQADRPSARFENQTR